MELPAERHATTLPESVSLSAAEDSLALAGLEMALTSADSVIYRWDLVTGAISFSDNITNVYPFNDVPPRHESGWLETIVDQDQVQWLDQKQSWQNQPTPSTLRYRIHQNGKPVWVRQSGIAVNHGKQVIGIINFHCRPPAATTSDIRGMKINSVSISAPAPSKPSGHYMYPEAFAEQLQHAMDMAIAREKHGALLILAVANFEMIVNAYGLQASETVMQEIGNEIKGLLTPQDGLYRIHRDQFGIIFADCTPEEISAIANQISTVVHGYGYHSSVGNVHAICATGTLCFPAQERLASEVIDKTFTALHKSAGAVYHAFRDGTGDRQLARQQMGLANYLRTAIHENKLRLAFQPIICASTGAVSHYEALLRMIGEDGSISSAGALIPVAERMGLIDMLDHMVLDMVIKELQAAPQLTLAFNVSNLTTENPQWLQYFRDRLKDKPEIATRIIVEITETAAHRDLRRTAYFVASVQEVGCQVAIDDFGSGYTSFRQLKSLSVDMVKIDGDFIRDLADNADNRFFVKTLLEFTRGFGLKSVAEFIENGETAKILMELGIDYMQGYYFGKPENYRGWLNKGEYTAS